jgi:hypothetical protein
MPKILVLSVCSFPRMSTSSSSDKNYRTKTGRQRKASLKIAKLALAWQSRLGSSLPSEWQKRLNRGTPIEDLGDARRILET